MHYTIAYTVANVKPCTLGGEYNNTLIIKQSRFPVFQSLQCGTTKLKRHYLTGCSTMLSLMLAAADVYIKGGF